MSECAILLTMQTQMIDAFDGTNIELHECNGDFSATVAFPALDMSCSATIIQGSIYFESKGKNCPLWARADAYDYPEHVSIIRRWLGRQ